MGNVIYGLKCPLDGDIKYIGKSKNYKSRYLEHLNESLSIMKDNAKNCWIRVLLMGGLLPELIILTSDVNECDLDHEEKSRIIEHSHGQLVNKQYNTSEVDTFYLDNIEELTSTIMSKNSLKEVTNTLTNELLSMGYYKNEIRYISESLSYTFIRGYGLKLRESKPDPNDYCIPKYYGKTTEEIYHIINNTEKINNLLELFDKSEIVKNEYKKHYGI